MTAEHLMPGFPITRLRRARMRGFSRRMLTEHRLTPSDFIWPLFVTEGDGDPEPIDGMAGVYRLRLTHLKAAVKAAEKEGIPTLAVFPCLDDKVKNDDGTNATKADNLICRAIKTIKDINADIGVMVDIALDTFTSHGHDGVIRHGQVDNDATLEILSAQSLNYAEAGADIVAPSDMMDGRIKTIRASLDESGYSDLMIMAYAAKYASSLYAPFREAARSSPLSGGLGDKASYQMNPANGDEALREIALDIQEGADFVMVKPGMPYLDIMRRAYEAFNMPIFGYQVSGEYQMIQALMATLPETQRHALIMEMLLAFKRAGCAGILSYFAYDVAYQLNRNQS